MSENVVQQYRVAENSRGNISTRRVLLHSFHSLEYEWRVLK